jgi:hypothetical protein
MSKFEFKTIKERYTEMMASAITVSVEDLQPNELALIEKGYEMFQEKLDDLKIANDEIKRLSIDLANIKAMYVDNDRSKYDDEDEEEEY